MLIAALTPTGRMQAFYADNWENPRVRKLLSGLRPMLLKEASVVLRIDSILSGESKKGIDAFREGYEGLPEGDIPRMILK